MTRPATESDRNLRLSLVTCCKGVNFISFMLWIWSTMASSSAASDPLSNNHPDIIADFYYKECWHIHKSSYNDIIASHSIMRGFSYVMTRWSAKLWGIWILILFSWNLLITFLFLWVLVRKQHLPSKDNCFVRCTCNHCWWKIILKDFNIEFDG